MARVSRAARRIISAVVRSEHRIRDRAQAKEARGAALTPGEELRAHRSDAQIIAVGYAKARINGLRVPKLRTRLRRRG